MQRAMAENLHGRDINSTRILAFQKKAPAPPEVTTRDSRINVYNILYYYIIHSLKGQVM